MFEISQLRCFVAVAEELHFGHAAARLNMTQPPLSRQIQLLEHHVGTQLLDRANRSVKLTAAGRAFLPEATKILRLSEEAVSTARKIAKGEAGSLSLGFTAALGYGVIPELVSALRAKLPGVALTLKELVTAEQLDALDAGQIDIGFMRPHLVPRELRSVHLSNDALMLAIPAKEAETWPKRPGLAALNHAKFLMYSPYEARYFHQLLQNLFDKEGVKPDIVEYVAQIHTMLALVSAGLGVALIPQAAAKFQVNGVVLRKLTTKPADLVQAVASYRDDNDNPALSIFLDQVLPAFCR